MAFVTPVVEQWLEWDIDLNIWYKDKKIMWYFLNGVLTGIFHSGQIKRSYLELTQNLDLTDQVKSLEGIQNLTQTSATVLLYFWLHVSLINKTKLQIFCNFLY